jgi:flagellar hook-basal body complex protein FliE
MELGPLRIAPSSVQRPERTSGSTPSRGFADALQDALGSLETTQIEADRQADAMARGEGNLHEVSLALEKADVSMRLATKVRNRFVDAYQEIMRMNI